MDQKSQAVFDDLDIGRSLVEVHWRGWMDDVKTSIGVWGGFERCRDGAWYLVLIGKLTIRMIDVVAVRRLPLLQESA